ncbi:hypothetical protein [Amycolatopsis sp. NPDC059021]|uniref:hypothetical protein n=1 Tax=Amycolatopsis sp. NPDC059021 TaxID=3346704 RepID=UPI00366F2073
MVDPADGARVSRLRVVVRAIDAWTLRTMNPSGVLLDLARRDFRHRAEERDNRGTVPRSVPGERPEGR